MYSTLIFNEKSIPFQNINDVEKYFPEFLELIKLAKLNGITTVKVNTSHATGWYETPLTNNLNVREWLKQKEKDYKTRVKSLIDKCSYPIINYDDSINLINLENSSFSYNDKDVQTLGCAYLLNELVLSYASHSSWIAKEIVFNHETYSDDQTDLVKTNVAVLNCSTINNWNDNISIILKEKEKHLKENKNFIAEFETYFPKLKLCGNAKIMTDIKHKSSFCKVVSILNEYMQSIDDDDFNIKTLKEFSNLKISGESESVSKNPKFKKTRTFSINGKKYFFELHVKNFPDGYRLHFYHLNNYIYIGYYGKHLKTKRTPK